MSELAHLLAGLYPDRDAARFFMRDAGLDPEEVYLETIPVRRWEKILEEAWKHRKLEAVVETAARKYEPRRGDLERAARQYLESWERPGPDPAGGLRVEARPVLRPGLLRYFLDCWLPGPHLFLTRVGGFPEPPERADIVQYLGELKGRIQTDMREKTYLPLAGRPVPSSPLSQAAGRDPFIAPIHQVILQLVGRAQGGDSASAQIAAVNRRSRVVRDVMRVLDSAQEPLILLGEPGSGKTMTLQQTAMALAARESGRAFPRAVLFVRLGEFHIDGRVEAMDVREYVQQVCPPGLRRWLEDLEHNGRLVILFDGMDEMSRDRYSEHTEALSVFAGATLAKTLFSCRITDFSPRFVHRRLVLLPFDRRQVAEYLAKYVQSFPIVVDNQSWKLGALARRIARGDLPIEANNPFVLWLLCLYLQERGAWPASRVDLLGFYNQSNYKRKEEELEEDEPPFPAMDKAFREWARFAYLITERNRGPVIPMQLLTEDGDPETALEMIRVGKRCGALRESMEGHEHQVRFEHHRFQEYFAAYHIHETRPEILWLDKLDAPRWQETMLNLILMGDPGGAVRDLTGAIRELTQEYLGETGVESDPLPDAQETVLADRVELSSRILRQSSGTPAVRQELLPPFQEAVQLLADRGNPITQVKMMRACQNVPEIDFIATLRQPLHSPINWVRNQALMLLGGSGAGARAVGSDLATEMGYDLANGLFPIRLPAYFKAVKAAGNGGYWWALLAGTLSFALNLVLLLAVSGALYYGAWSLRSVYPKPESPAEVRQFEPPEVSEERKADEVDFRVLSILGHPGTMALFGLLVLIAAATAIKLKPSALWAVVLGSAFGILALGPLFLFLWQAVSASALFMVVGFCVLGYYTVFPLGILVGAASHFASLALYLTATAQVRSSSHSPRAFFAGAWKSCHFADLTEEFKIELGFKRPSFDRLKSAAASLPLIFGVGALAAVFLLFLGGCYWLLNQQQVLPLGSSFALVIAGLATMTMACLVYAAWAKQLGSFPKFLGFAFLTLLIIAVVVGFIWLFGEVMDWLFALPFWGNVLRVLVVVLAIALCSARWPYCCLLSARSCPRFLGSGC
ncbi:MAG TPA: NACHT domain-containing protein [Thermoanaerobaculia bacterium]|nr:NACHT domain-containing protein [Thermoanaerobaculia bacterium]